MSTPPCPSLILFRHGNTFESGETPVMVGARTDLPLTATGEEQAHAASVLLDARLSVRSITAGPLQRTQRFAQIIARDLSSEVRVTTDNRLREIDYGQWEGLDSPTIIARYGESALRAWEQHGEWPDEVIGWQPSRQKLSDTLADFLSEQHQLLSQHGSDAGVNIAITSNGILRIIYALVTNRSPDSAAKVKTGGMCVLTPMPPSGWQIATWNITP